MCLIRSITPAIALRESKPVDQNVTCLLSLPIGPLVEPLALLQLLLFQQVTQLQSLSQKIDQFYDVVKQNDEEEVYREKLKNIINKEPIQTSSSLLTSLFGPKSYSHKIILASPLPQIFFKLRNISLSAQLVDQSGKKLRNTHSIDICLAVCQLDGRWIQNTEEGQPYLKGASHSSLLTGQALFRKFSFAEISRKFKLGKIALVVYARPPSMLYQKTNLIVDNDQPLAENICPLIVEDIVVKAKKRKHHFQ